MTPAGPDPERSTGDESVPAAGEASGRYDGAPGRSLSPALIATLVAIPVMVLVGFITFAALRPDDPTPIESYTSDGPVAAECARLLEGVPDTFDGFGAKTVSGDLASWPAEDGGDPLTVRCGVSRPSELAPTSGLQAIYPPGSSAGVQWFITDSIAGSGEAYVSVDHRPYVAMWVPANAGNGPITDVSATIEEVLPRAPLDFG